MAFQISCNFPAIESYKDAFRAWEKGVALPKEPAIRGLVDKRKKHLTVGKTPTLDIVLRLYGHDTVTWHPDNAVTIRSYCSKSTAVFVRHCTPFHAASGRYFSITVDGRTYRVGGRITLRQRDNTWKPDKITPWVVPVVNRERARQARDETNYNDFRLWLLTYVQMAARPEHQSGWAHNEMVVHMLRERKWRELVTTCFPQAWDHPDDILSGIRKAIYHECDCIDRKEVPFLG